MNYLLKIIFAGLVFFVVDDGCSAQTAIVSGTVKSASEFLEGANIAVEGKNWGTRTDVNGFFELKLPTGFYTLLFSYTGYDVKAIQVNVTDKQPTVLRIILEKEESLQKVVVLGTRSGTRRSITETAVPKDNFSARELLATGKVEPTQMLNYVAPSFNSSRQTIADGTDHIDPATLRGLGPDQLLVLLNGHRRHSTALLNVNGTIGRGSVGTDLNAIPTAMIDNIEVLRDGASSQYGSDAIAGAINISLKKNRSGFSFSGQAGKHYEGDGGVLQGAMSQGFALGKKGFLTIGGDYRFRQATNRSGDYTGTVYFNIPSAATPQQKDSLLALDNKLISDRGFSRSNNMQVGNSELENIQLMLNGGVPLGSTINLFFNAGYGYRDGRAAGFYRYPKQTSQVIAAIYPDGFLPQIWSNIKDKNVTVGIDGKTGNWYWDLSNTYGDNSFGFDVHNSNNASMYQLGRNAPTSFYAGKLGYSQNSVCLNVNRDLAKEMGVNSFNVAAGFEYRQEQYSIREGEEASWKNYDETFSKAAGAQVFPGFQPANALNEKRHIFGVYLDVESDLNSSLLVEFAGRYENYSDYGSNIAARMAARLKLSNWLALRGAFSTGFRAPSMQQRFFNAVSTVFIPTNSGLQPFQQGTFRNDSKVAAAFGIPSLTAETSLNLGFGMTAKLLSNKLNITADVYQITIKNRITYTGAFRRVNAPEANIVDSILDQFSELNAISSAAFLTNAIDTRSRGFDLVLSYHNKLGRGNLALTAAANFNSTKVVDGPVKLENLPDTSIIQNRIFSREDAARLELGQPKSKVILSAVYRIGNWSLTVRETRFGPVETRDPNNPALDEAFHTKWVMDADVGYHITPWLFWHIGAANIFDTYPDPLKNTANTGEGRFIYSRNATQFGFNGGYYYTGVNIDLNSSTVRKKKDGR